jgi:hypothetical protein
MEPNTYSLVVHEKRTFLLIPSKRVQGLPLLTPRDIHSHLLENFRSKVSRQAGMQGDIQEL